jgi:excisionase family DNA binding protein
MGVYFKEGETLSNLLSVSEYARKHKIAAETIRRRIAAGRIEATKVGNQWCIPADAPLPEDRRVKSGKYKKLKNKQESNTDE